MRRSGWQRNAQGWWERLPPRSKSAAMGRSGSPLQAYWDKQYQEWRDALGQAYEAAEPAEKARIELLDARFSVGDYQGFVEWARATVPGSMPPPSADVVQWAPLATWPHAYTPTDVWVSPDDWEGVTLYHGTPVPDLIVTEGVCVPPAVESMTDPEYGWTAYWHNEIWRSYSKGLSDKERAHVANFLSVKKVLRRDIGELFSLLFVSESIRVARRYGNFGAVFTVDPTKLAYFWTLEDDLEGERSTCFVLPSITPQAMPEAFELVEVGSGW